MTHRRQLSIKLIGFSGGTKRFEQSIPDTDPHGTSINEFHCHCSRLPKSCSFKEIEPFSALAASRRNWQHTNSQAHAEYLRRVVVQWLGYNILEEMIAQVLSIYMDCSLILLQIVLMSCPCSFSVVMTSPSHLSVTVGVVPNTKGYI